MLGHRHVMRTVPRLIRVLNWPESGINGQPMKFTSSRIMPPALTGCHLYLVLLHPPWL
uniref:Uncharacterized protein n=1 Tax=Anguilla anguilla TaxID=7936 RepID=A0A0E9QXJ8_ANGAN